MIGKITSSTQDIVYVEVRVEDGTYTETVAGGSQSTRTITGTFGQSFIMSRWFSRIKIAIANGNDRNLIMRLYDGPAKTRLIHETVFKNVGLNQVLHLMFDPLPPTGYYWEIDTQNEPVTAYIYNGSTFGGAYENGTNLSDISFKSKIMQCTDEPQPRPLAVEGDDVDNGAAQVKSGSALGAINTGTVEKNISRSGDEVGDSGRILTGSWFLNI